MRNREFVRMYAASLVPMAFASSGSFEARAQEVLWERESPSRKDSTGFGMSFSPFRDFDADGVIDLLAGESNNSCDGTGVGIIYLLSGASGAELDRICGGDNDAGFGDEIHLLDDLDGDGVQELALGAAYYDDLQHGAHTGKVIVMSGSTHTVIRELIGEVGDGRFGQRLAAIPDVDGDGIGDLLIGAHAAWSHGQAYVYSTNSGALLRRYNDLNSGYLGSNVAAVGDVDADGVRDYAVTAGLNYNKGRVWIYSTTTGAELLRWDGPNDYSYFGYTIADLGDFDGDGHDDMLVNALPTNQPGFVYCYSGSNGTVLFTLIGERRLDLFGGPLQVLGDMNRDSYPEVLIGAIQDDRNGRLAGAAYLISTKTQRPLYRFLGSFTEELVGRNVAGGEDFNGDGIVDGIVSVGHKPKVGHRFGPEWVFAFAGNDLFLQASDTGISAGETVTLETRGGEAGALTILVLTDIRRAAMFIPLSLSALDSNGESAFTAVVPDAASGLDFTLRAYAQRHAGGPGIIDSSVEIVTVE